MKLQKREREVESKKQELVSADIPWVPETFLARFPVSVDSL